MARVLFWILAGLALMLWWRHRGHGGRGAASPDRADRQPPATPAPPQAMVACAHCGVHLPQADALLGADGRPYCSAAHRDGAQAG